MAAPRLSHHISQQFDRELDELRSKVLAMGGLVEDHLQMVLDALTRSDPNRAEEVALSDFKVNAYEMDIDEDCTGILLRRQPAASDLRLVMAVSKTITDLERVGDEIEKIARIMHALLLSKAPKTYLVGVVAMGNHVRDMVHNALDAFARTDSRAAIEVVAADPEIDRETEAVMRQLITYMIEDPRSISAVLNVVLAVRAFERIGDHAKNICENVIYFAEGKDVRHRSLEEKRRQIDPDVTQAD